MSLACESGLSSNPIVVIGESVRRVARSRHAHRPTPAILMAPRDGSFRGQLLPAGCPNRRQFSADSSLRRATIELHPGQPSRLPNRQKRSSAPARVVAAAPAA